MTITVYTFERADGTPSGEFSTQDATKAKEHAQEYGLRCIANEFEFADSEIAWDFTGDDQDAE